MPLTPGFGMNLRQLAPDPEPMPDETVVEIVPEGKDTPEYDNDGNIISIEHEDGSITISLDGSPLNPDEVEKDEEWFSNLANKISDSELSLIADDLLRGISDDIESRRTWIDDRQAGVKMLGLKLETPGVSGSADGAPLEGMSKVRHPLLLEACLRFQANARSEMLPADGPVKIRNDDNNATFASDSLANAYQSDMNHYLTSVATEYYPDTDRMFMALGFGGTAFKKVYFCPLRNRPVSETVDADDLIVNNAATDLANAKRITHRVMMKPSTVKRLQIIEVYRDIDLGSVGIPDEDAYKKEIKEQQGIAQTGMNPEDSDREIYECYCELEIPGYKHVYKGKETGLPIPYIVTIDKASRQVLSVVRNYDDPGEEDSLPVAKKRFVKFTFVPGFGFYDIGLLHILGNTTNAITAAWRELLDAGMYNNFPGFIYSDAGGRQNTNIFRVPPGGGVPFKTGANDLTKMIMPLPYKEPSGALMNLVQNIAETGMRVGGTAETMVGEGKQDAPVGTTLALIEQAQKVLSSVHKRLHASQSEEFELLTDCFREHPESFWQRRRRPARAWDEKTFRDALDNYLLVPRADPNTESQTKRLLKVAALKQLQNGAQNLYDPIAVERAALQALGWSNPNEFLVPPSQAAQPTPEILKGMVDAQNASKSADARVMDAETRRMEVQGNLELGNRKIDAENGGNGQQVDPTKVLDLQVKREEIQQRNTDAMLDAINRKRDRESRERLAAIKLAENIAQHPETMGLIDGVVDPAMLKRLEGDEPTLDGTKTGEL